tara:strand:+ start:685 stop:990 length:306 start_codon:yes stop_codon:yes gene_type:complete
MTTSDLHITIYSLLVFISVLLWGYICILSEQSNDQNTYKYFIFGILYIVFAIIHITLKLIENQEDPLSVQDPREYILFVVTFAWAFLLLTYIKYREKTKHV